MTTAVQRFETLVEAVTKSNINPDDKQEIIDRLKKQWDDCDGDCYTGLEEDIPNQYKVLVKLTFPTGFGTFNWELLPYRLDYSKEETDYENCLYVIRKLKEKLDIIHRYLPELHNVLSPFFDKKCIPLYYEFDKDLAVTFAVDYEDHTLIFTENNFTIQINPSWLR